MSKEWFSVDNLLPEIGVPVMTVDMNHHGWMQPLLRMDDADGWLWCGLATFSNNILDPGNYECDDEYTCTHWKPLDELPEPPNE